MKGRNHIKKILNESESINGVVTKTETGKRLLDQYSFTSMEEEYVKPIVTKRACISAWEQDYVMRHLSQGHSGHCYAWLDGAFCPQHALLGSCCYKHEYPSSWTEEVRLKHQYKLRCMQYLWNDYDLVKDRRRKEKHSGYVSELSILTDDFTHNSHQNSRDKDSKGSRSSSIHSKSCTSYSNNNDNKSYNKIMKQPLLLLSSSSYRKNEYYSSDSEEEEKDSDDNDDNHDNESTATSTENDLDSNDSDNYSSSLSSINSYKNHEIQPLFHHSITSDVKINVERKERQSEE